MATNYYRGQGKVYIATRAADGTLGTFAEVGDADKFEITQSEQFDQVYESQSGARVKAVHSATQLDVNFSLDILNFNGANLARAILGTTTTAQSITGVSSGAAAVTYETLTEAFTATDSREYCIVFEGKNMNRSGTSVIVRAHRAYMNVASAISLLGTATAKFTVAGALLPDPTIVTAGKSQFLYIGIKDEA
jgi:hypothetical protein